jgi:hypothetical protein
MSQGGRPQGIKNRTGTFAKTGPTGDTGKTI